jgi:O-antigen/teichoic acid export membrane protein
VRYGIWALVFPLVDYIWFFELGLNTALVNFIARYDATGEPDRINEVVNTALLYFSGVSVAAVIVAVTLARDANRIFQVSPAYSHDFATLCS